MLDGARTQNGMVSFAPVLTPELAEMVRAYVVARANETYPEVQASLSPPPH